MPAAINSETVFQQLFHEEYPKLCRYALTYLHDTHTAEDVVQDTFIKIWEQKRDLITTDTIRFYLITAVRNNCISYLRKQKSQNTRYTEETPEPEPEASFSDTQLREMESDQARQLAEALNQLPPKCREVFLLVKLHGMSYKQAAESLDISVKTVENQMGKAIKTFREMSIPAIAVFMLLTHFQKFS